MSIIADPIADTPRLAYADWLDEQDDPKGHERAKFIRLGVAESLHEFPSCNRFYDQMGCSCQACALASLEQRITPYDLGPPFVCGATAGTELDPITNRGFVDTIRPSDIYVVAVDEDTLRTLFANHPITTVRITRSVATEIMPNDPEARASQTAYGWRPMPQRELITYAHWVPNDLGVWLRRDKRRLSKGLVDYVSFPDHAIADSALSRAFVNWARVDLCGLEPIQFPDSLTYGEEIFVRQSWRGSGG